MNDNGLLDDRIEQGNTLIIGLLLINGQRTTLREFNAHCY